MAQLPPKRHRLTEWMWKRDPNFCCIQESQLTIQDRYHLRVKEWKTILEASGPKNQTCTVILISDKVESQPKLNRRDRERHYILKGRMQRENSAVLNIHAPNTRHRFLSKKSDRSVICVLTLTHWKWEVPVTNSHQQTCHPDREMLALTSIIKQMDLTDSFRTFHPNTKEYTNPATNPLICKKRQGKCWHKVQSLWEQPTDTWFHSRLTLWDEPIPGTVQVTKNLRLDSPQT